MSKFYDRVQGNCRVDFTSAPASCWSKTYYTDEDTKDAPRGVKDLVRWLIDEAIDACSDKCWAAANVLGKAGTDKDGDYIACMCPGRKSGGSGDPNANIP